MKLRNSRVDIASAPDRDEFHRRLDTDSSLRVGSGDALHAAWELSLRQECGKSIDVSQRVERPLDLYWPGHARNPGVPHVRSH